MNPDQGNAIQCELAEQSAKLDVLVLGVTHANEKITKVEATIHSHANKVQEVLIWKAVTTHELDVKARKIKELEDSLDLYVKKEMVKWLLIGASVGSGGLVAGLIKAFGG